MTNRSEYLEFHKRFCERMIEITKIKNTDYGGGGSDAFNNFRHIGNFVSTPGMDVVALGFLTRMSDKFSRLGSFIANGTLAVKDESAEDALLDLANYAALFAGYLREKQNALRKESSADV